jgi:hypothetical protein
MFFIFILLSLYIIIAREDGELEAIDSSKSMDAIA